MTGVVIDTSGSEMITALVRDQGVLAERRGGADREAGRRILEFIDEMLGQCGVKEAELDRIGVVVTAKERLMGVRTGVAVANALAVGWGVPVVEMATGSLDSLIIHLNSENVKEVAQVRYLPEENS